jgi:hypothetical protein
MDPTENAKGRQVAKANAFTAKYKRCQIIAQNTGNLPTIEQNLGTTSQTELFSILLTFIL